MSGGGAAVWRGYDQAALDAQYNMRAAVPDFADYFRRWAAASEAARRALPCRLDLAYGPGPRQRLDLFLPPAGASRAPLLVFLHGGYWQAMDKSDHSFIAPAFCAAGIAVAVVNYTLAPSGSMDERVGQVRAALAFLAGNAAGLGIDGARIAVSGHSAGGHLTAMALLADWPAAGVAPPCAYCAISGIFELEPIRLSYLNRVLGLDEGAVARNSPARLIGAGRAAAGPIILAVGERETAEFHRQQAAFASRCSAAKAPPATIVVPGTHHFSILDQLADRAGIVYRAVLDALTARQPQSIAR